MPHWGEDDLGPDKSGATIRCVGTPFAKMHHQLEHQHHDNIEENHSFWGAGNAHSLQFLEHHPLQQSSGRLLALPL